MKSVRYILIPFSILYSFIIDFRNKCYDLGIFKSKTFLIPIIAVGNLNTGGTGKTPFIEYLTRLLKNNFKVTILSRGYKRKTKGFFLADNKTTVNLIGDEPMQYHLKFKDVKVAVDENRVRGINNLLKLLSKPDVVLLDDAFQHRKVKAGLNFLLTSYNDLYINDYMLPSGNLRETPKNAKRASHIIVTKCPVDLSGEEKLLIKNKLKLKSFQKLYFTAIKYQNEILSKTNKLLLNELKNSHVILVTGIANPKPLKKALTDKNIDFKHFKFNDHHFINKKEKELILNSASKTNKKQYVILTTEKDYVRSFYGDKNVFYLPIEIVFLQDAEKINKEIIDYVGQSSRNG